MTMDNKVVELAVGNNPSFDAVQAMPLDTAKTQSVTLTPATTSHIFTLGDNTLLVDLTLILDAGSADIHIRSTDSSDNTDATLLRMMPGKWTFTIPAVSRDFLVGISNASTDASVFVQLMET